MSSSSTSAVSPGPGRRGRPAAARRGRRPRDAPLVLRAVSREADRAHEGVARADQRPVRDAQPHPGRRHRDVPDEARRVARALRQDAVRPLRAPPRGRTAQRTTARRRRVAVHAARADRVRPRPPGGAQGRDALPRPVHAPRARGARPARRNAAGRPGPARHRQSVRDHLRARRDRRVGARHLSESARLAPVHGTAAVRPHVRDQQALHLAQPVPGRPRRAARDQGGAARAQRVPALRRQGAVPDVLEDAARGAARRSRRHRGAGDAVRARRAARARVRGKDGVADVRRRAGRHRDVGGQDPRGAGGARGSGRARARGRGAFPERWWA